MNRDRLRQYALIAGFILFVLMIAFALYWVFFRSVSQEPETPSTNNTNGGLPNVNDILGNVNVPVNNTNGGIPTASGAGTVANGGATTIQTLTPDAQADAVVPNAASQDEGARYYDAADGKFYSVTTDGTIRQLGNAAFPNADSVTWSPVNNQVIVEFPDGTNVYYDLSSDQQVTLPKEFEDFAFAPDGKQISFKYLHSDPERRVLAVSSPDGSQARTLEALGKNESRVQVQWSPTGKVAATYNEFVDANRQEIGFLGLNDENFKGTVVEGRGFEYIYSKNGAQMLYSTYSASNEYRPRLQIVDADGESIGNNRRDLNIDTFADKCTFSGDSTSVYCGVPSQQEFGYGLDRRVVSDIPDDIYKIDLKTGLQTRVAIPVDSNGKPIYTVAGNSMVLTADGQLLFKDLRTNRIVKMQL